MRDDNPGHKQLGAWQRAEELAAAVFRIACDLPSNNDWLASDLTRAAVAVPANIAEGYAQETVGEYLACVDVARGSLARLESYLLLMGRIDLIGATELKQIEDLVEGAGGALDRLWQSLRLRETGSTDAPDRFDFPGEPDELYEADE